MTVRNSGLPPESAKGGFELALTGGYDLLPFTDAITGKTDKRQRWGAILARRRSLATWNSSGRPMLLRPAISSAGSWSFMNIRNHSGQICPHALPLLLVKGCAQRAWMSPKVGGIGVRDH